ncbi:MAG: hypothetical protein IJ635_00790 [Bacteroidaceae bacterium]|nr:hypothetical protein [Bacteroidaceae bacterium]MBR1519757.1 hypothetical protein [Bacteroidaceae bacterium]
MALTTMNPAQMMVIESFAGASSEDEMKGLMKVLKKFYAERLNKELERLWDNGTLNQERLDVLRTQHLRTPYRS